MSAYPLAKEWSLGYAKQASSDWVVRKVLLRASGLPTCHQLHYLQMACEKLCKAHLCDKGSDPENLQKSHAYVGSVLPVIFRMRFSRKFRELPDKSSLLRYVEARAREIDLLAPSVDDDGRRKDNCEYPWKDGAGNVVVPAKWQFTNQDFTGNRASILFFKLIEEAMEELNSQPPTRPEAGT